MYAGVILSADAILTDARACRVLSPEDCGVAVMFGSAQATLYNRTVANAGSCLESATSQRYRCVHSMSIHPLYRSGDPKYALCVMRLAQPIPSWLKTWSVSTIYPYTLTSSARVQVTGWSFDPLYGCVITGPSDVLHKTTAFTRIDLTPYGSTYHPTGHFGTLTAENQGCTGGKGAPALLYSPSLGKWTVLGLAVEGGLMGQPGIFFRPSLVKSWIDEMVAVKSPCWTSCSTALYENSAGLAL